MEAIVIEGRSQFTIESGTPSEPLEAGIYDVWATEGDGDAYIKVSADAADADNVSDETGYLIPGGKGIVPVRIGRNGLCIGTTNFVHIHRTA